MATFGDTLSQLREYRIELERSAQAEAAGELRRMTAHSRFEASRLTPIASAPWADRIRSTSNPYTSASRKRCFGNISRDVLRLDPESLFV